MSPRFRVVKGERVRPACGRVPPHDLDAEAAVLSAVLYEKGALDRVQVLLRSPHFYSDANGRIYEAAEALAAEGQPVDVITVASWLRNRERLEQVGGAAYVAQLADATPAVHNLEAHAQIVLDKWRIRQLIATCQRIAAEGYGDVGVVEEFLDSAEESVLALRQEARVRGGRALGEAAAAALARSLEAAEKGSSVNGVATGLVDFDELTTGLYPGDLVILAARPAMGKSALGFQWAEHVAAQEGQAAAVFSLEMPDEQLGLRHLATGGRVDLRRLRQGRLTPDEWRRVVSTSVEAAQLSLWIDDTPGRSIADFRARLRHLQAAYRREGLRLSLAVLDYLQLVHGRLEAPNREQQVAEVSRGLKQTARELGIPVVALSQLNRAVEQRSDKRPQLSDLRDSGSIEQDADAIVFVYRDEYYNPSSADAGIAELLVAKQRNGPTGTVRVCFEKEITRFANLHH